jgi:hypothetical protein
VNVQVCEVLVASAVGVYLMPMKEQQQLQDAGVGHHKNHLAATAREQQRGGDKRRAGRRRERRKTSFYSIT